MSPERAECPALSREYPSRESRPRARGQVPAAPEHVPTAQGLAGQITEAFPWDTAPLYLIRDNDGAYGARFRRRVRAMGIRDRPIRPYSPWMNGHVERLIGTIRRECLDHVIILDADHLRRVLRAYAEYYNESRTHLALAKDARPMEAVGRIVSRPVLGGLPPPHARASARVFSERTD